jgi:hypothetical protein
MNPVQKYRIFIGSVVLLFLYLLLTEIPNRLNPVTQAFSQYQKSEELLANPASLERRLENLKRTKKDLEEQVVRKGAMFDQSPTGVYEYVSRSAALSGITMEAYMPVDSGTTSSKREVGFTVRFKSTFHKGTRFINEMERGVIPVSISRVEIGEKGTSGDLEILIIGTAYIFPSL